MESTSHTEVTMLTSLEVDCLLLNKIIQPNMLEVFVCVRSHAKYNIQVIKKTVVGKRTVLRRQNSYATD